MPASAVGVPAPRQLQVFGLPSDEDGPAKPTVTAYLKKGLQSGKDFVCQHVLDEQFDLGPQEGATTFEEQAARSAFKFEVGYIFIEVLAVAIYGIVCPGRPWPSDHNYVWPAGVFSVIMRLLVICFRLRSGGQFHPHVLSMILILVDVLLLTSCHPNVSELFWWENDPPVCPAWGHMKMEGSELMNMNSTEAQQVSHNVTAALQDYQLLLDQWELDLEAYYNLQEDEATMVMYSLQILIWYMTIFVLLLRHAVLVVPFTIVIYNSGALCIWHGEFDVSRTSMLELVMLAFSLIVALIVKSRSEVSQRKLFQLLQETKGNFIDERVKRYELEFANELRGIHHHDPDTTKEALRFAKAASGKAPSVVSTALSSILKPPPSVYSAPPALHEGPMMLPSRRSGECLPPDAVVWVEGQALPQPVSTVTSGDRVLCYDSLGLCPRYVEVVSSKLLLGTAAWVVVQLEDGTSLTLTSDHPTQPRRAIDQLPFSSHVPAADLSPETDSLMVLKMLPVRVASVQPLRSSGDQRVALSLRQPERHEVFVAPRGGTPGQDIATVAVGSADANTRGGDSSDTGKQGVGLTVKRTFIDLEDEDGSFSRASSCPPRVRYRDAAGSSKQAVQRQTYGATGAQGSAPFSPSFENSTTFSSLRRACSESDLASQSSRMSSTPTDVDILVAVTNPASAATVSEIMEVRNRGLPSLGTAQHASGNCQACIFENRYHRGEGGRCFKGLLCERCHECHDAVGRKKRVAGGTRTLRKAHASKVQQYQHQQQEQYQRLLQ